MDLAVRALDADDEHVLGQPALLAGLPAGDAQRMALLAEQRVAAVTGADAADGEFFREMHDVAVVRVQIAGGMHAFDEVAVPLDACERGVAHAGHELHVGDHVGAVGDLHAAACVGRVHGSHAVGDDVHRAALHAAVEQAVELRVSLGRVHPVVVGAGIGLAAGADESEVFDPRHVRGVGAVQVAVGVGVLVQFHEIAGLQHLLDEILVLAIAAGTPVDVVRPGQTGHLVDPVTEALQRRAHRALLRWRLGEFPESFPGEGRYYTHATAECIPCAELRMQKQKRRRIRGSGGARDLCQTVITRRRPSWSLPSRPAGPPWQPPLTSGGSSWRLSSWSWPLSSWPSSWRASLPSGGSP